MQRHSTGSAPLPLLATGTGLLVVVAGCGHEPLTEDDIVERVATAQREAPSFEYEWTSLDGALGLEVTYEGVVRYDEDGEVELLSHTAIDEEGEFFEELRVVDGAVYSRSPGTDEFQVLDESEADDVIAAWDWAGAAEQFGTPEAVDEVGEADVEGTSTTEYEVTFSEVTQTWWIDDDDRLMRIRAEDDGAAEGYLRAYGEEITVEVPDQVRDSDG